MGRPRQREIAPVLQKLLALSGAADLEEFARAHNLVVGTVRTWDKRGAVPAEKLAAFAGQYGVTVGELKSQAAAIETSQPNRSSGQIEADSFSKRLATAMDIVTEGLRANGVDENRVPRAEMAAAVFKLLPWPIPKTPGGTP